MGLQNIMEQFRSVVCDRCKIIRLSSSCGHVPDCIQLTVEKKATKLALNEPLVISFVAKKYFYCVESLLCLSSSQQALPEENYTTEHHDIFTIAGRTCIEEGNSAQVLSIVLDEKNQVRCIYISLCFRMFTCVLPPTINNAPSASVGHSEMSGLEPAATPG